LNTTNSKFDHKNNWENYNLGVSAYQKERKGDLKAATNLAKAFKGEVIKN
tara:strand:+ start:316 stop:465 length:150 start_codon:yes stop_codon:yes gene_type:complete